MLIRAFFLLLLMSCNISYAALFGDDEAREQIQVLRKQVSEMEARIAKMEQALNSQALLELYAQVETLGLELGKLNGQVEMLSNDNTLLQKRQRDFYIDLDNRLREIEQPNKRAPSSSTPPKSSPHSMATPPSKELGFKIALPQGIAHHQHRLLERQRFLDEVVGAHLDRADRRLDVAVPGNDHHLRIDLPLAEPLQGDQSIKARQPDVEHDDVVGGAVGFLETLFAGLSGVHVKAFVSQHAADGRSHAGFIVNNQDGRHQAGSSMINRVPVGRLSVTSMLPPCSATMRRTIARPRPLPRPFVE